MNKSKLAYQKFLDSHIWAQIRRLELIKADYRCKICSRQSRSNHVHHIWYDDWNHPEDGSLVVLCEKHHEEVHKCIDNMGSMYYNDIPNEKKWDRILEDIRKINIEENIIIVKTSRREQEKFNRQFQSLYGKKKERKKDKDKKENVYLNRPHSEKKEIRKALNKHRSKQGQLNPSKNKKKKLSKKDKKKTKDKTRKRNLKGGGRCQAFAVKFPAD